MFAHLINNLTCWEICLFSFLQRVRRKGASPFYHSLVCTVKTKLQAVALRGTILSSSYYIPVVLSSQGHP